MTKEEIVSKMRFHQGEYEKLSQVWKDFVKEEETKRHTEKQTARLEAFKGQYKFYADGKGEVKEIDFEEVAKLLSSGYMLGYNEHGEAGLSDGTSFSAMVEDEVEGKRYAARFARIAAMPPRKKS